MKGFVIRDKDTKKYVHFGEMDRDYEVELIDASIFRLEEEEKEVWIEQAKIEQENCEFEAIDVEINEVKQNGTNTRI